MLSVIISIIICVITFIKTRGKAEDRLSVSFVKGLKIANIAGIVLMSVACVFAVMNFINNMSIANTLSDTSSMDGTATDLNIGGFSLNSIAVLTFIGDLLICGLIFMRHIKNIKKLKIIRARILQNTVVYCKKCGAAVAKGMSYCTACGAAINNTALNKGTGEVNE